ncbi:beta-ketoacyl-ACP synthase III [Bilophila wadsworthia]|uniref:beta-ketoacyl-ACP synthase III n=1 Tax=Bilophila wadsworthia TaxID=35833 RepID=UPI00242CF6FE|nr:beta-ketoacyl-ACP synthase III [Bilophila wadsworthia]
MTAIHIQGLGTYVPTKRITNVDLMSLVDTNDEWIVSRTGIKARHMLADDENGSDAGTEAALKALEDAGIAAEDITHVLTATCTPDYLCPSTACIISGKIGSHGAMAFDLNAACTGFVYGLDVANSILAGKPEAKVLLVGSEAFTRRLNWEDRTTCILFGDGAAAAVLTNGDAGTPKRCLPSAPRLRDVRCGADGRQYPLLTVGGGTNRNYKPGDPVQDDFYLQMHGREVFKQAVRSLSAVCSELLEDNGLTLEDIDLFIPHQANLRIIEAVGDRLKLGSEKIFVNLDEYGNTSAASIPLGIGDACAQGRIRPGSRVLLSAFGGGFTWGAALLEF